VPDSVIRLGEFRNRPRAHGCILGEQDNPFLDFFESGLKICEAFEELSRFSGGKRSAWVPVAIGGLFPFDGYPEAVDQGVRRPGSNLASNQRRGTLPLLFLFLFLFLLLIRAMVWRMVWAMVYEHFEKLFATFL
jgi:hypothetical protein